MGNFRILIVDDEPDFLELMSARIKTWGYEMIKAINAREAVQAVKTGGPDMIILDYMLPDMDGIAALKEIRGINSRIPIIMFTAYPDKRSMEGTKKLGISAFIPKLSLYSDAQSSLKSAIDIIEKNLNRKG